MRLRWAIVPFLILSGSLVLAQPNSRSASSSRPALSHPSWWNFASPEATALVGLRWERLKASPFSPAIAEEWQAPVGYQMPDLECLRQSRQILLSSPPFLAAVNGDFTSEDLRDQAAAQAMKASVYRGVELWISPGLSTLSVARITDQLLLVGLIPTLKAAIDRNQPDSERHYSPLLQRAAKFSGQDLWVVSALLPDPLASAFVPLEVDAQGFDGSVDLSAGIRLEATLDAGSPAEASALEGRLQHAAHFMPPVARGLQVVQAADLVVLTMLVSPEQLEANLRPAGVQPSSQPQAQPSAQPQVRPLSPAAPAAPTSLAAAAAPISVAAAAAPVAEGQPVPVPAKPSGPRVVRILGLDEGPREIILPQSN